MRGAAGAIPAINVGIRFEDVAALRQAEIARMGIAALADHLAGDIPAVGEDFQVAVGRIAFDDDGRGRWRNGILDRLVDLDRAPVQSENEKNRDTAPCGAMNE